MLTGRSGHRQASWKLTRIKRKVGEGKGASSNTRRGNLEPTLDAKEAELRDAEQRCYFTNIYLGALGILAFGIQNINAS